MELKKIGGLKKHSLRKSRGGGYRRHMVSVIRNEFVQ